MWLELKIMSLNQYYQDIGSWQGAGKYFFSSTFSFVQTKFSRNGERLGQKVFHVLNFGHLAFGFESRFS